MKQTKILMDMPITVEVIDGAASGEIFSKVFSYFRYIDGKFSIYKENSEISLVNKGLVERDKYSPDLRTVLDLSEKTRIETEGYFDIFHNGKYDPSGLVKGWAIYNAALIIDQAGFNNFFVDAGGDVQVRGRNRHNEPWRIGLKNPFNEQQIIKIISVGSEGVATSGTYLRGQHIYNPKTMIPTVSEIVSLTVIGPNIYEADRFATAAFAMGRKGIYFIEKLAGFEGYLIDKDGQATLTSGFDRYCLS